MQAGDFRLAEKQKQLRKFETEHGHHQAPSPQGTRVARTALGKPFTHTCLSGEGGGMPPVN